MSPNMKQRSPFRSFTENCDHFERVRREIRYRRVDFQDESYLRDFQNIVKDYLSTVSQVLWENPNLRFLHFKPELSGSMLENTKVHSPNELDFLCVFTNPDFQELHQGGRIFITAKSDSIYSRLTRQIDGINSVCPYTLSQVFYSALKLILDRVKCNDVLNAFLLRRNKVSTLRIEIDIKKKGRAVDSTR